ncbi:MAG: hypothetical protein GY855_17950, partial [candidate division Zixibacteria bacterium]|nr:hypothetical protein [candidate division Zixibacteria bacterium]
MVYDGDWLYCVALCCNNNDCLCDPYDFYDHETFSCDIWTIIRGERRVQVWFKGEEIYDAVHVGFGIEDNKPEIRDFDALQFDGVPASANAIFDVDEIMGLRLECYWPETVEPFVSISLI